MRLIIALINAVIVFAKGSVVQRTRPLDPGGLPCHLCSMSSDYSSEALAVMECPIFTISLWAPRFDKGRPAIIDTAALAEFNLGEDEDLRQTTKPRQDPGVGNHDRAAFGAPIIGVQRPTNCLVSVDRLLNQQKNKKKIIPGISNWKHSDKDSNVIHTEIHEWDSTFSQNSFHSKHRTQVRTIITRTHVETVRNERKQHNGVSSP